jgi:co-chaperonin GroES (HSP10)
MKFNPQNRYLLIQTQKQEDAENTGVLLPEGYVIPKDKYVTATVLASASDCKKEPVYGGVLYQQGSRVVVDGSMIENVSVAGKEHEIVLENYVVGMFVEEE